MSQGNLFGFETVNVKGRKNDGSDGGVKPALRRMTADWVELLMRQNVKPPLIVLAEIYSEDVEHLATRLDMSKAEAEKFRIYCAEKAAQYWHDKPGQSVELPDGRLAVFMPMIFEGRPAAFDGQGVMVAVEPPPEIAERLQLGGFGPEDAPKPPDNSTKTEHE